MLMLGEFLSEREITVSGIQLPGHGSTPDDMIRTGWHDWAAAAEQGLLDLRDKCEEVFVAGLSMGGALTLYLASRHTLPGAASLSGAVFVKDRRISVLMPFMSPFVRFFPKDEEDDFADPRASELHKSYDYIPLPCLKSLLEFLKAVRKGLPDITCPMLVAHSHGDIMLGMENADYIMEKISSGKKEFLELEKSGHVITLDVERDTVFEKVYGLIQRESKFLGR